MNPLHAVFSNLDHWRHLPAYQLERRADIFFSVYLPRVLEQHVGTAIDPRIVPEFPIKRDLIWPDKPTHLSVKVDYVLFAEDRSRAYLIELKTDSSSRRSSQDLYLARARELGFTALLEGLVTIVHRTTACRKYYHLLCLLEDLGFLRLPDGLAEQIYPSITLQGRRQLREITIEPVEPAIEVVYLQPEPHANEACIDFEFFASCLDSLDDPLSEVFRAHLRRWTSAASSVQPSRTGS